MIRTLRKLVLLAGFGGAAIGLSACDPSSVSTGGSVYFLTRRDITGGSLNLTVQAIDPDTGRVTSTRTLTEGVDYRIDHLQGHPV